MVQARRPWKLRWRGDTVPRKLNKLIVISIEEDPSVLGVSNLSLVDRWSEEKSGVPQDIWISDSVPNIPPNIPVF